MIDVRNEELLPLREVPRTLPPRPNGKRLHISAVYRWIQRGVSGIKLESVRVGGSTYTSCEALKRFATRLSSQAAAAPPQLPTSRSRERMLEGANAAVERKLKLGGSPDAK